MIKLKNQNRETILKKFESWVEIPMMVLVLVMIVTIIIPLVVHLPDETHLTLEIIDWIIWAIFALELSIRTYLSPKRLIYLRNNWLDLLVVLLPILRIFRVFRAARLLRILRFGRVLALFGKFTQEIKTILARHHLHYILVVFIGLIAIGSVLIYHFDQGVIGGNENLTDSIWLAIVNAFSGGFANIYPAGPEARGISILLILFGTVIVSYFTASLASYFTEKEQDIEQARIEKKLDELIQKVDKLAKKLGNVRES